MVAVRVSVVMERTKPQTSHEIQSKTSARSYHGLVRKRAMDADCRLRPAKPCNFDDLVDIHMNGTQPRWLLKS